MSDEKKDVKVTNNDLLTLDNFQKYVLGFKGDGVPRALYDIIKDVTRHKKRKNKRKKHRKEKMGSAYSFYTSKKKKKKDKDKKYKHWNINDIL